MADISRIRVDSTTYDLKDARLPAPGVDGTTLVADDGAWTVGTIGNDAPVESGTGVGSVQSKQFVFDHDDDGEESTFVQAATGDASFAVGAGTTASGMYSHAEGYFTTAYGNRSHAEGDNTLARGANSHAEGEYTIARGEDQHVSGKYNIEDMNEEYAEIVGNGESTSARSNARTLDWDGNAWYAGVVSSNASPNDIVSDDDALTTTEAVHQIIDEEVPVETGTNIGASATYAGAMQTKSFTHGGNTYNQYASAVGANAFGMNCQAGAAGSFAEGYRTEAAGVYAHAEGQGTHAVGYQSHAEGIGNTANGDSSHVEGSSTSTLNAAEASHAEGVGTTASSQAQHVQGKYNIIDSNGTYAHIVGNGTSSTRSNAHTLDWNGNAWYAGTVSAGTVANPAPVTNANDLATKAYVDANAGGDSPVESGSGVGSVQTKAYTSSTVTRTQIASGEGAFAEGSDTKAFGDYSHAEGFNTEAQNTYSHAEGFTSIASGEDAHAEGNENIASGEAAHAEGYHTLAAGSHAHTEGTSTSTEYWFSAEGYAGDSYVTVDSSVFSTDHVGKYLIVRVLTEGQQQHSFERYRIISADASTYRYNLSSPLSSPINEYAYLLDNIADGEASHTENIANIAVGDSSHAEGFESIAYGKNSHSEGGYTYALSEGSHAEGLASETRPTFKYVFITGKVDGATNTYNVSSTTGIYVNGILLAETEEGHEPVARKILAVNYSDNTIELDGDIRYSGDSPYQYVEYGAYGKASHIEGINTRTFAKAAHAEGSGNRAYGISSHAEGYSSNAIGDYSHCEGDQNVAKGKGSHAEGWINYAIGQYSHAEGSGVLACGDESHAEGIYGVALGKASHVEGWESNVWGQTSVIVAHVSGTTYQTNSNFTSLKPGYVISTSAQPTDSSGIWIVTDVDTTARPVTITLDREFTLSGVNQTVYYRRLVAIGDSSHAEGLSRAVGNVSHAEGSSTASAAYSHAEGASTANSLCSHSEGQGTIATSEAQHVEGKYNVEDTSNQYAHITGVGTSTSARANGYTLDWSGNGWFSGNITANGGSLTLHDSTGDVTVTAAQLRQLLAMLS